MNRIRRYLLPVSVMLALALAVAPVGAMLNPSAVYCTGLGYSYTDRIGADGSMTGSCILPGNQSVDAWQFLEGKVSPELSYCKKLGLEIRTISDPRVCGLLGSTCAVCVKADGTTQEVTKMMGLDLREKICSGNVCCDPAQNATCPIGEETGTQPANLTPLLPVAFVAILVIAGIVLLLRRRGRRPVTGNPSCRHPERSGAPGTAETAKADAPGR